MKEDLNKKTVHFRIILLLLFLLSAYSLYVVYYILNAETVRDSILIDIVVIFILIVVLAISLLRYQKLYLKDTNQKSTSTRLNTLLFYSITGTVLGLIDLASNQMDFRGTEMFMIPSIILLALIARRKLTKFFKGFKNIFADSLLTSIGLFLVYLFVLLVFHSIGNSEDIDSVLDLFGKFFGVLPNLLLRVILCGPILLIATVIFAFMNSGKKVDDSDILDSSI